MNDWKKLIAELREQGWTVEKTGRGHNRAIPRDPSIPFLIFSDSEDRHAWMNTIRDLTKKGFVWPPPNRRVERARSRSLAEQLVEAAPDVVAEVNIVNPEALLALAPPMAAPLPDDVTPANRLDWLYVVLRDARQYVSLAGEHVAEKQQAFDDAKRELDEAIAEDDRAKAALREAKASFDQAFDPPSGTVATIARVA